MTDEERAFEKCERLYPKLAYGRPCYVCASKHLMTPATEVHHIMPRVHKMLRFEPLNLMPLCHKHHQLITDKKLDEPITTKHREWLQQMSVKDFKGMLIARGMTKAEYYEQQYRKLKEMIL
ncbi:MAG: HNH endonuclease [Lachnospiraceae bacterium]|nr:HNH endonuclease [Lachnospiraceae bacterium]